VNALWLMSSMADPSARDYRRSFFEGRGLKMKRNLGGPALVVASIALFVALGEGAVAAGIVPLARHAITATTASNALKLGGKTPAQIKTSLRGATGPQGPQGPAGAQGQAGAANVTLQTKTFTLNAAGSDGDNMNVTASCASGQKATGGGYAPDSTPGLESNILGFDSRPTAADDGWTVFVYNVDGSAAHGGTIYAVCLG
jgi:hypothetical protein